MGSGKHINDSEEVHVAHDSRDKPARRIGLFAAAGKARRLRATMPQSSVIASNHLHETRTTGQTDLALASKEILPVYNVRKHWHPSLPPPQPIPGQHPEVAVGDYLMDSYLHGGVDRCLLITRSEKEDLLRYYRQSGIGPMQLEHVLIDDSPSTPFTVAKGLQTSKFEADNNTAFALGFPDIIIYPHNIFDELFSHLTANNCDVVLGLFKVSNFQKYDMVKFDQATDTTDTAAPDHLSVQVRDIDIKPVSTELEWTWVSAVWSSAFSQFFMDTVLNDSPLPVRSTSTPATNARELYIGDILLAALQQGMRIDGICFRRGTVLDIGTPEDFKLSRSAELFELFKQ